LNAKGLADNPDLLRIPREFLDDVAAEEFDEDDLPDLVRRLPRFSRTFFHAFFDEELGIEITSMGAEERELALDLTVDYEKDEEKQVVVPLLFVFVDLCELYIENEELSTPEQASEHQDEILELTARLLQEISLWARESERIVLGGTADDLARRMARLT